MSFQGPEINKRQGGLARTGNNTDGVFLFVYTIPTADLPSEIIQNKAHLLYQIEDAEALGITAAFDANKKLTVYHQLKEFFRLAPESMIYFMSTVPALPSVILSVADVQAQIRTYPDIKGIGIGGLSTELTAAVADVEAVQTVVSAFANENRDIDFVIIAPKGDATPVAISAYADLRLKNAPNVSISIAQDPMVAALDSATAKYADVGSVLAGLAIRKVNENLGSVDVIEKPRGYKGNQSFPLTSATSWRSAALSDGKTFESLGATAQKALTDKGYIYAGSFEGYPGVFFNNAPTCVSIQSDYAFIENNRVWNKAKRLLRTALIPKIRSILKKDANGYLRPSTVASLTEIGKNALNTLLVVDEISAHEVVIEAKQIVDDQHPLKAKMSIVRDGILHEMEIDLGYAASVG